MDKKDYLEWLKREEESLISKIEFIKHEIQKVVEEDGSSS